VQISPINNTLTPIWSNTERKESIMRLAPIAASIIIATMAGGAFAATSNDEAAQDRTNTAAYGNTHKWYEAGDRVIQS